MLDPKVKYFQAYTCTLFVAATPKDVVDNLVLKNEREEQLVERKRQYQWQYFPDSGLPSAIKDDVEDLPDDEQFGVVKSIDFTAQGIKGLLLPGLAGAFMSVNDLEDYRDLLKNLDEAPLAMQRAGRWTSDIEFGRQMLNGINPVVIEKCTELPDNFPVTDDLVGAFLTRGKTLKQEMEVHIIMREFQRLI